MISNLTTQLNQRNFIRSNLLLVILLMFQMVVFGQGKQVTGTVTDASGGTLPGVNVLIKGTTIGTITDFNGKYSINVTKGNEVLVFSFIGFIEQSVTVGTQSQINVSLKEDVLQLNEVVAVGYGVQKKKLNTGATLQVSGDAIQKQNAVSAMTALQGVTPGVQIVKSSGQPGDGFSVSIRGLGTTGNASPLYIVDGLSMDNINYLSPSDIESIDVLKDAASSAIYGARAANGVILVTTKQGKVGKASITLDAYYGVQNLYKAATLLNAQEYALIMNEQRINSKLDPWDFASTTDGIGPLYWDKIQKGEWKGTNWLKEITNENAPIKNYTLNVAGGTDLSNYSIGLGYTEQEGILGEPVASHYERYNVRINSEHILIRNNNLNILKVGENLTYSFTQSSGIATGNIYSNDVHNVLCADPLLPMYADSANDVAYPYHYATGWNKQQANPVATMKYNRGSNISKNHKMVGKLYFELQPIKNLNFRSSFGYNMSANTYRSFVPAFALADGNNTVTFNTTSQNMGVGLGWTFENTASYKLVLTNGSNLDFLVGTSAEKWGLGESMTGSNVVSSFNDFEHAYLDNCTLIDAAKTTLGGKPYDEGGILSYFGRVNYNYNEKYLLTAILRADASSNFMKGKRWGYFPSFSAGWVATSESFMEGTKNWLDFLKVRASWGRNGNQAISPFQYLSTISFTNANYAFGRDKANMGTGAYPDILPNLDVTWETSEQTDLGFDARLFNSHMSVAFDVYNKSTKDWLVNAPVLATYGTGSPFINGGDVSNKGAEVALGWRQDIGDFSFDINTNFAYNKNEVTRIANTEQIIHGPLNVLSQGTTEMYRAQVGFPIGYFWGYKTDGIFQNTAEVLAYKNSDGALILPDAVPGDVRFVDTDGNGTIDQKDKVMIGDPHPDFTYGVTFNCSYKGFDLSVQTSGVGGNQIAKSYRSFADSPIQNYTTEIFGRWHGEGTSNKLPRVINGTDFSHQQISDIYIEDGDYYRINNVTLGFDVKKVFKKIPFAQLRLYVTAQNLYTFTNYTGMDPEVGYCPDTNNDGKPDFSSGIDLGFYPSPRTYMVGVNIKF
jgi:TonB-dependent starch-binding outer membrane protein SusC